MFSLTENHNLEVFHCPSKQEVTKLSHLEKIIEKRGRAPTHFNPVALTKAKIVYNFCIQFWPNFGLRECKRVKQSAVPRICQSFSGFFFSLLFMETHLLLTGKRLIKEVLFNL